MLLYALTILASAFLLFQVQPIIARIILPWFGGSSAVWTTCLLFFQSVLLLGYVYSHWLYSTLRPRWQAWVHVALLAGSVAVLPVLPAASWKPSGSEDPTVRILLVLAATVGLPYFLLSTTGPLLQAWYARRYKGALPYRLYALSNAGSMLALVTYPVLFEPWLGTRLQAVSWSWAYGFFVLLCGATALSARNSSAPPTAEDTGGERPAKSTYLFWIGLPACASILLLATTNHISENVAAIPFLWILPLSLYLFSFILCFEHSRWYQRKLFLGLFAVTVGGMAYALSEPFRNMDVKVLIPLFAAGLFICCMVCHGELARLKPHPRRLTTFYVMIALGGAMGGVFVALIAPRVFAGFYELPVGLAASAGMVLLVLRADASSPLAGPWLRPAPIAAGLVTVGLAGYLGYVIHQRSEDVRLLVRNFYGGLKVTDTTSDEGDLPIRRLTHGTITHGEQFLSPKLRDRATTYYGPNTGVGRAIRQDETSGPLRVGLIGLGAGTLAAYGRPGDYYRFYEINPLVLRLATTEFTFLKDCKARLDIALGDARLSLEREPPQNFDVLAVDAFSGDSIPVHLLTREAFALYFRHLKPDGVLAVHVSNKHLELKPVVQLGAASLHKDARVIDTEDEDDEVFGATWVLVTSRRGYFDQPLIRTATPVPPSPRVRLWTDDYSNLFTILK